MSSKVKFFTRLFFCVFLSFLGLWSGQTMGSAENDVIGMRLGEVNLEGSPALRLVIETDKALDARLLLLNKPWRLVVDSAGLSWNVPGLAKSGRLSSGPATAYRFGHPKLGTGRLVVEMSAPASPERVFKLPPHEVGGHRLVIDLIDKGLTRFKLAQKSLLANGLAVIQSNQVPAEKIAVEPVSLPQPVSRHGKVASPVAHPSALDRKWIVAIDAGHGGKDPGAVGLAGTKEKEITLAAAQQLASELRKTGKVSSRLIRSSDRFYKLRQRIEIARDMGADLFISLHADSAPRKAARGISVFTLSDTASDKEAAYIAQQENKADLVGGPDLAVEDPAAANALLSMFQRETMNESSRLAAAILNEIHDMPGGDKRGHRFAGFAVLKSPDIPSVLVEMGFLSNKEDEKNLNSERYRHKLTQRLSNAIVSYLKSASF
ncbi:MAG: N-acetylmuramoyl-L-alanine amidase [Rhodospirillaceae bacterium]|nr:N-acetylmuramoyl-L-alanine amidase [Rhodospirillaceae bacterium]